MGSKQNSRHIYLATITVVALALLLVIQIIWTIKSAAQEEKTFSQLAAIAVTKAQAEIISTYPVCCTTMRRVVGERGKCKVLGEMEHKMDSIITKHLKNYSLDLDYTFVIQGKGNEGLIIENSKSATTQIQNNFRHTDSTQLQIQFPHRTQFLVKQMQGIFISSIAFIAIIFISFFQLLKLLKLEKQKYADTENFVNNMVHEFQTPISNIKLSANMLSKKIATPTEEVQKIMDIIKSETERLRLNTVQILNFNSLPNCAENKEILDMEEIIMHCVNNYTNKETINLSLRATNNNIFAGPNQIIHLITNLIDNAFKYSTNTPIIDISSSSDSGNYILQVTDRGIGIEKENLKKIFDKYYRVDNQTIHNVKGFGLGLAYVKQIAENLNGTIKVESKIGHGSTFTVSIPLYQKA